MSSTCRKRERDDEAPLPSDSLLTKRLKKLIFVLKAEDQTGVLSCEPNSSKWPTLDPLKTTHVSLFTMTERVLNDDYPSLTAFQTDFNLAISAVLKHFPPTGLVYKNAILLESFGTSLINSIAHSSQASINGVADPQTHNSSSTTITSTPSADIKGQKTALIQRGPDGTFYFSNSQLKEVSDIPAGEKLSKVKIIPTPAINIADMPRLGASSKIIKQSHDHPLKKKSTSGIRTEPVDFKDYGVFFTFAPTADSSKASISVAESTLVSRPGRHVECVYEDAPPSLDTLPVFNGLNHDPNSVNLESIGESTHPLFIDKEVKNLEPAHLADMSLNSLTELLPEVDWSLVSPRLLAQATEGGDNLDTVMSAHILAENAALIHKLLQLQGKRYHARMKGMRKDNTKAVDDIERLEIRYAQLLKRNLHALAKHTAPSDLIAREKVADSLSLVRLYDPGFVGTLPQHKQHAFETNQIGRTAFVVDAGAVGVTLQKDQVARQQQMLQHQQRQFQILQQQFQQRMQIQQQQQTKWAQGKMGKQMQGQMNMNMPGMGHAISNPLSRAQQVQMQMLMQAQYLQTPQHHARQAQAHAAAVGAAARLQSQ
ncbi:hypothetical protein BASA50_009422 [Batrachochytrium salamandrivorans]|uniref:GLTSCR protein conserved domain-containing protein n=1 Tax=Batrachochytrium salamandrivorans TaxID=1357716 RepID=A0ABQ8F1N0_9FUNG|nr:hypothetical protein BASA50_009422 [Batrachochytrium salamandrivorans]KAH6594111.1 hypothetical protein BASA61_004100 [Batrachochytrium salamandrivorans]KAH9244415.1 hypothetical protein BASA81_018185 [Batrachochytrium salamandrivorans]KAH9273238.1 hypothetical protein BASA83_004527 [Batrachochytrium salamandrivorans]KAJ1344582.1 hypothetical protein BSLG_000105 [Batrachochytrium salamandrivorans]